MNTLARVGAFGAGVLVAVGSVALVLADRDGGDSQIRGADPGAVAPDSGGPCMHPTKVTLSEAERRVEDFGLFMPAHADASATSLSSAWICAVAQSDPSIGSVVLEFDSGMLIRFSSDRLVPDPVAEWTTRIAQGSAGRVDSVRGKPALLIPPAQEDTEVRGAVQLVEAGTLVRVSGSGDPESGAVGGCRRVVDPALTPSAPPLSPPYPRSPRDA
jgi:hypothetical protein